MKKVIIASIVLFFAAVTNVNAAPANTGLEFISIAQEDTTVKRTPVIPTDLPDPIKQTLATDEYKGWTPSSAFLVAKEDKEYYEVKLTKEGSDANQVKFSKEGKKVD